MLIQVKATFKDYIARQATFADTKVKCTFKSGKQVHAMDLSCILLALTDGTMLETKNKRC